MDEGEENANMRQALRKIAEQRDDLLGEVQAIPSARRAILSEIAAREFPLEAAVVKTTTRRDQLLAHHQPKIPDSVAQALLRHISAARQTDQVRGASRILHWRLYATRWPGPRASRARAVVLAACLVITAAIVYLGHWGSLFRGQVRTAVAPPIDAAAHQVARPTDVERTSLARHPLSLRVSAAELTTLRSSFFATNRVDVAEAGDEPAAMRLDLPPRALLMSDDLARTP